MAIGDPFGSLDASPDDWRDQEAQDALNLQQRDEAAKKAKSRTWGDTARDVAGFPSRMPKSSQAPQAKRSASVSESTRPSRRPFSHPRHIEAPHDPTFGNGAAL